MSSIQFTLKVNLNINFVHNGTLKGECDMWTPIPRPNFLVHVERVSQVLPLFTTDKTSPSPQFNYTVTESATMAENTPDRCLETGKKILQTADKEGENALTSCRIPLMTSNTEMKDLPAIDDTKQKQVSNFEETTTTISDMMGDQTSSAKAADDDVGLDLPPIHQPS